MKVIRIIVAVLFFIPSIPFFWVIFSLCGIIFLLAIYNLITYFFNYLLKDTNSIKDNVDIIKLALYIICYPIIYWRVFINADMERI